MAADSPDDAGRADARSRRTGAETVTTTSQLETPRDSHLKRFIECSLGASVLAVQERPVSAGSYESRALTVRLMTGEEEKLFLKDYGRVRIFKKGIEERRDREIGVYRDLLRAMEPGTARYYDSVWDEGDGRSWLLLEFVDGRELHHCSPESWEAAVVWLADMQAKFAVRGLLHAADFLPRHDASFFHFEAERAVHTLGRVSAPLAARVVAALARYEEAIEIMATQPKTLVHGSYRKADILVGRVGSSFRICPVDWERAAIGAPLYDLPFILGEMPDTRVDHLLGAYLARAQSLGLSTGDSVENRRAFRCFLLHRTLELLRRRAKHASWHFEVPSAVRRVEALAANL